MAVRNSVGKSKLNYNDNTRDASIAMHKIKILSWKTRAEVEAGDLMS